MAPPLVFRDGPGRFSLFPVTHSHLWAEYKKQEASFWTSEEIDLSSDKFEELSENEQSFIEATLAFFSWADGLVAENLINNFISDVQIAEARQFFGFQAAMEGIHAETYGLLIQKYISKERQKEVFYAMERMDCMKEKAAWMSKWLHSDRPFAERLIAFACVEGIMFCGAFATIFWLKKRSSVCMHGLTFSNELISRDESLHCDFACKLYAMMPRRSDKLSRNTLADLVSRMDDPPAPPKAGVELSELFAAPGNTYDDQTLRVLSDPFPNETCEKLQSIAQSLFDTCQLSDTEVQEIIRGAVKVEEAFLDSALPIRLIDMSKTLMMQYMGCVADRLLRELGVPPIYHTKCPWDWLELISLQGKTNFFERRVGEYQKAGVMQSLTETGSKVFSTDEDF